MTSYIFYFAISVVVCSVVLCVFYWIINRPIRLEKMRIDSEADRANSKQVTPIRLNAYERLVLFLERTSPDEILNREMKPNMICFDLQVRLLKSIREEFEHNVSLQIYVAEAEWEAIVSAKNNIVQIVNIAASQVGAKEPAIRLAQSILSIYNSIRPTATENAISALKNQIGRLIF